MEPDPHLAAELLRGLLDAIERGDLDATGAQAALAGALDALEAPEAGEDVPPPGRLSENGAGPHERPGGSAGSRDDRRPGG